jgi:hypothetical protein
LQEFIPSAASIGTIFLIRKGVWPKWGKISYIEDRKPQGSAMTSLPHFASAIFVTAGAALWHCGMASVQTVIPSAKVKEARA